MQRIYNICLFFYIHEVNADSLFPTSDVSDLCFCFIFLVIMASHMTVAQIMNSLL